MQHKTKKKDDIKRISYPSIRSSIQIKEKSSPHQNPRPEVSKILPNVNNSMPLPKAPKSRRPRAPEVPPPPPDPPEDEDDPPSSLIIDLLRSAESVSNSAYAESLFVVCLELEVWVSLVQLCLLVSWINE